MKYDQRIIIKAKRDDPFARIDKAMLDDPRLSTSATGVLCYLLGKPPGWKVRVSDVAAHFTNGEKSIRASLKELRTVGYARLCQVREGHRIREWVWMVSDSVIFSELDGGNELVANELVQDGHISKNDSIKRRRIDKKSRMAPSHA